MSGFSPSSSHGGSVDPSTLGWYSYGTMAAGVVGTTVPTAFGQNLPWTQGRADWYPGRGTDFFDHTDPTLPVVINSGIYSIAAFAAASILDATKTLQAVLYLDYNGVGEDLDVIGTGGGAQTPANIRITASATRYLTAGMVVAWQAYHDAGVNVAVSAKMLVQRLA